MGKKIYREFMFCVYKKAIMRYKPDSESTVVAELHFGDRVYILHGCGDVVNGRVRVVFKKIINEQSNVFVGWTPLKALTPYVIEDYAKLFFFNKMGRRIPVSREYHGKTCGYIDADERVQMIAKCGDWCLTSKGWTKWAWMDKWRDFYDDELILELTNTALELAVNDYKSTIHRIKKRKYKGSAGFCNLYLDMCELRKFFKSETYKIFYDGVLMAGAALIETLDESMGVNEAWHRREKKHFESALEKAKYEKYCRKIALLQREMDVNGAESDSD